MRLAFDIFKVAFVTVFLAAVGYIVACLALFLAGIAIMEVISWN